MTPQQRAILLDRFSRFAVRSGPPPSPRARHPGAVDGAWWPRTNDLVTELPGLEPLLGRRAGDLCRIMYNMDAWQPAPRRTMMGGCSVHLDGYRHLPARTVCVVGLDHTRLVLLTIPTDTENAAAQALLSAASRPGNELTAFELMAAHTRHHLEDTDNDAALRRWDDEGGRSAHPRRVNTTVPEA